MLRLNHHNRRKGVASLNGFARGGTEAGIPTARGASTWSPMQVSRLLVTPYKVLSCGNVGSATMRRSRPSRPRSRSDAVFTFDRVTNVVFVAVLTLGVVAFTSYGPEETCRRIAEAIASHAAAAGQLSYSGWVGGAD